MRQEIHDQMHDLKEVYLRQVTMEREYIEKQKEEDLVETAINKATEGSDDEEGFGLKRRMKHTTDLEVMRIVNLRNQPDSFFEFEHIYTLDLTKVKIEHEDYNDSTINCFNVRKLLKFYGKYNYDAIFKINDEGDVIIVIGKNNKEGKIEEIREIVLIKRNKRQQAYFLRPEVDEEFFVEKYEKTEGEEDEKKESGVASLLSNSFKEPLFLQSTANLARKALFQCKGVQLVNDRVLLWSDKNIFHGRLDRVNSSTSELAMKTIDFSVPKAEGFIETVVSKGPEQDENDYDKYYLIIKIQLNDIKSSYIVRYNLKKEKEFSSFDCSEKAEIFYDFKQNAFILDEQFIIDMQQGLRLQFFKAKLEDFDKRLNVCDLDVGNRFSVDMEHFLIRGTVFLPYTYFSLTCYSRPRKAAIGELNSNTHSLMFRIDGNTIFHSCFENYKQLKYILKTFKEAK